MPSKKGNIGTKEIKARRLLKTVDAGFRGNYLSPKYTRRRIYRLLGQYHWYYNRETKEWINL